MTVPAFLHPFARPAAEADSFLRIVRGEGAAVWDQHGRRYVDALASLWYCAAGHGRAEIAGAVHRQLLQLDAYHTFERFTHEPGDALCDRLASLAPFPGARVFLTSGGSEAVDTAIKLARVAHHAAGRPRRTLIVSRAPSYHGVTYGGMSCTGLPLNQQGFGPLVGDVVQVPKDDLNALDAVLAERGHELAAVIAEPVVGAGGLHPPRPGYLQALRDRCDRHGGFLILDEVITGFGRLGRWFASDHYAVRPDLLTFAKAVTSGYQPLGGVLVGEAIRGPLEADPTWILRHGTTYSGHPAACAAALANLDILEREDLLGRAVAVGRKLAEGLQTVVDGSKVLECRGVGAMWGLGMAEGVSAIAVRDRMIDLGVIARPIGPPTLVFCPPLTISDEDIGRIVDAARTAVAAL